MDTNASVNRVTKEYIAKIVIFFPIKFHSKQFYSILIIQVNSCWNIPCEGCQQTKANDTEFSCT